MIIRTIHRDNQLQPCGQTMQIGVEKLRDRLPFRIAQLIVDAVDNDVDMIGQGEQLLQMTQEFQLIQLIEKGCKREAHAFDASPRWSVVTGEERVFDVLYAGVQGDGLARVLLAKNNIAVGVQEWMFECSIDDRVDDVGQ